MKRMLCRLGLFFNEFKRRVDFIETYKILTGDDSVDVEFTSRG